MEVSHLLIVLSIAFTAAAYGLFPYLFALFRRKPITPAKYGGLCYGINFLVMILFMILKGGASTGAPYFLWTTVFFYYGKNILRDFGRLDD
jgi:hypothetical protein